MELEIPSFAHSLGGLRPPALKTVSEVAVCSPGEPTWSGGRGPCGISVGSWLLAALGIELWIDLAEIFSPIRLNFKSQFR